MARSYGRIATSIWRDPDFRDRSPDAKLVYLMLVTQAEISPAGLLDVTLRRWTTQVGLDADRLDKALIELDDARFILIDDGTEELLVRSFVKWDGGSNNELRRRSISDSADAVQSPRLAMALTIELDRQGVPHGLSDRAYDGALDSPPDRASIGHRQTGPNTDTEGRNSPSDRASDTRRVVVTEVSTRDPQPTTLDPEPLPPTHRAATRPTTAPSELLLTDAMRDWATTQELRIDLASETDRFLDWHRAKGTTHKDWVAAWRNWMRRATENRPASAASSGGAASYGSLDQWAGQIMTWEPPEPTP